MESCIYKISNLANNKSYIGSCKNARIRWNNHKSTLSRGIHHSSYLQNAWNKYGKENFIFQILELCDDSVKLDRENFYIQQYSPEYNILKIASRGRYKEHSEYTKQLISSKKVKRKIYQFSLKGELIKEWESISSVTKALKIGTTAHLIECCKGKRATCKRFRWSYSNKITILPTKYKYE